MSGIVGVVGLDRRMYGNAARASARPRKEVRCEGCRMHAESLY